MRTRDVFSITEMKHLNVTVVGKELLNKRNPPFCKLLSFRFSFRLLLETKLRRVDRPAGILPDNEHELASVTGYLIMSLHCDVYTITEA
jgi:hypothetical protein